MWTALSSFVFGSRPLSNMGAFADRSVDHYADESASKTTGSGADKSENDKTEDGFAIHARRVKTHNTLRQALEKLEGNMKSTAGAIKVIMAELGTILVGDVTDLPEDTVYDIIPARGRMPIESFIRQCVINQESIEAWARVTEEAIKRMFDAVRELHQPLEKTSFAIQTALAKMLPLMELPNLAPFDATLNHSDDRINDSFRKGIDCLEYLVKTQKSQMARYQALDLKPFIDGTKQTLLLIDDSFTYTADIENDALLSTLLKRIFDVSDQAKFMEALEKSFALLQEDHLQNFVDIQNNLTEFLGQLEHLKKTYEIDSA